LAALLSNKGKHLKILVTAKYISGNPKEGGSSRFMRTVIDTLRSLGHDVIATTKPGEVLNEHFDLIICSHLLAEIKDHPAKKIFISQGIINDEAPGPGADRYISISEEVRKFHLDHRGIDSEIIGQPIVINERKRPSDELKNILVITREPMEDGSFSFLADKYDLRYSDIDEPIENQIDWADLCITLGRGALEAMAQGKPVIVADNRSYIGAYGDGYINWQNITEAARCNFSGRRYRHPLTREWIEGEIAKYNAVDSLYLHKYVSHCHDAYKIIAQYLSEHALENPVIRKDMSKAKISFGCMVNDPLRLDMVLKQSCLDPAIPCHIISNPVSATKGLNKLLNIIEAEGADIAILTHQDMHYRQGWIEQVREQLSLLPDNWIVAGIIGKDLDGLVCGKFHDMRIPLHFNTSHLHDFPHPASCFDECTIIVNMKSGFRFDESMEGFDLYGTLCVLQTWELGGTAWILDAFAEHYCMRPFTWCPDDLFLKNFKWLYERFETATRLDSTAIGLSKEDLNFATSAS
jgi:hypothetical protein